MEIGGSIYSGSGSFRLEEGISAMIARRPGDANPLEMKKTKIKTQPSP